MTTFGNAILTGTAALGIYMGAISDNMTVKTSQKVQGICSELLVKNEQASKSLEFWKAFVRNSYPKTKTGSLISLEQAINSLESHPILGTMANKISEAYVNQDAPKNINNVTIWTTEQMQENLADIIHQLMNYEGNDGRIQEIAREKLQEYILQCSRNAT